MATLKEIFEGNTADILEATELLKVLGDREGQFVWKKLTAQNGTFVDYVTADSADAYPNGGTQDGYWYELFDPLILIPENIREGVDIWGVIGAMSEGVSGIDFGMVTPSGDVGSVTVAHNLKSTPAWVALIPVLYATQNGSSKTLVNMDGQTLYYASSNHKKSTGTITKDASKVTFNSTSGYVFKNTSYYWFAVK